MDNSRQVNAFLTRLSQLTGHASRNALGGVARRHENNSARHREKGTYPGDDFLFVGVSQNLDRALVGTDYEARRKSTIGMMLEQLGDRNQCVTIVSAVAYEGFEELLGRFEMDLLSRMNLNDIIGPAYDEAGNRIPDAFCVWRRLAPVTENSKVLVSA